MSELACRFFMFFDAGAAAWRKYVEIGLVTFALSVGPAHGQDNRKVPISFLPPPLENATYSLGIYDAKSGNLARRLQEIAPERAFTVGLNGLMTSWDGNDDAGKAVPPGKYAARGYAVGAMKVEGVAIHGNDWTEADESLRVRSVEAICWVPSDDGFCTLMNMASNDRELTRFSKDGKLIWRKPVLLKEGSKSHLQSRWRMVSNVASVDVFSGDLVNGRASYRIEDGSQGPPPADEPDPIAQKRVNRSATDFETPMPLAEGKDHSVWGVNSNGLYQTSASGEVWRVLPHERVPANEIEANRDPGIKINRVWKPWAASASASSDLLYLLELATVTGEMRMRGIELAATKQENGRGVSEWRTFLERGIRVRELENQATPIEIPLVENPLLAGKPSRVKLMTACDDKGSSLTTADGLRLRRISQRADLKAARLAKGKTMDGFTFFQSDGAAWDEFSIEGAKNMMAFDAGEFEMTADGEKMHTTKPAEPADL